MTTKLTRVDHVGSAGILPARSSMLLDGSRRAQRGLVAVEGSRQNARGPRFVLIRVH